MRLDTTQALRLQQKLILAPRMIQSMEILQMPNLELQERLEQELENNPVLELKEKHGDETRVVDETPEAVDVPADPVFDDYAEDDWADEGETRRSRSRSELAEDSDRKQDAMLAVPARAVSLQDHLLEQLGELEVPAEVEPAVRHLIANVKPSGYLPPLAELLQGGERTFTVAELEAALPWLQQLDPPGVGARDLRECLLLQIGPETPHREVLRLLVDQHWDDLSHNRLPQIQRKTGIDLQTLNEALDALRHLNPRPGALFGNDDVQYVVPDLIIERTEDGDYTVRLTDEFIPEVRINKRWLQRFKQRKGDEAEREYLRKKIQSAQWIVDAILQRRQTLEKVTKAIIDRQRDFLDLGPEHIHPLKMQQIADQIGVHVTTVSRAVDDKWVQTPRGTFPLKRFFGGGTTTHDGEEVAYELIKQKMLDIVAAEDKANPLSDEDLMAKLNEAGYPVARRTVTKYRKLLKIPSSRQRRQWGGHAQTQS
jgi:RNA polymerase sigma-54 factor